MHAGFASLILRSAKTQRGRVQIYRQATKFLVEVQDVSVTVFTSTCKHTTAALPARPMRHTSTSYFLDKSSGYYQWRRYFVASRPVHQTSVWPTTAWPTKPTSKDPHSHKRQRRQRNRRRKRPRRKSKTEIVLDASRASEHLCAKPVLGVTDFLLRGTSIPAPASSTARSNCSSAQPSRRSHLVRARPDAASSPKILTASSTHEQPDPASPDALPLPRQPSDSTNFTIKPMVPRQTHSPVPISAKQPPWHCALWRAMQYINQPMKDAAATAFDLLQFVMPLPAHHALPQPALTTHNADAILPQSLKRLWPMAHGSLMEAATANARGFPHSGAEADAQLAFAGTWKLDRFAADKSLPQFRSSELLLAIRASHVAVTHASHCNNVALQVIECAGNILRAVDKWPSAEESSRITAELRSMVSTAATRNLEAFPLSSSPSEPPIECQQVLDNVVQLCLAVGRSHTHVPACTQAPKMMWHALHGGFADARGNVEPLPLPRLLSILQAVATLGTRCRYSKQLTDLAAQHAPRAIAAAVAESLHCRQAQDLLQLTWWDWVRFYVPQMGLWAGLCAASMAPAPVQHTRGLAVMFEPGLPQNQATQAATTRWLCVPTPASFRNRRCLPWSVYAVVGTRPIVDSMTLLVRALLSARLCQARFADQDTLTPAVFSYQARSMIAEQDWQVFSYVYAALHAFPEQRSLFPQRLLMVDRCVHALALLDGAHAVPSTKFEPKDDSETRPNGMKACDEDGSGSSLQKEQWEPLSVSHSVFDTPEATAHKLACLQRMDPMQPPLWEQLQKALQWFHRAEKRRVTQSTPFGLLGRISENSSDEGVLKAIITTLQKHPKRVNITAMILARMRQDNILWICDHVADLPASTRFGRLFDRLSPGFLGLLRGYSADMSNEQIADFLRSTVQHKWSKLREASKYEALCQVFQAATALSSIQGLDPGQKLALLRLMESDARCASVKDKLRPSRKHDGAMCSVLQLLNMRLLPLQMYRTVREVACTAAEVHAQKEASQRAVANTGWADDVRCLMRQVSEIVAVAGSNTPVAGCQVTMQLEEMSRRELTGALKQGLLALPAEMQARCINMVKSSKGTPSELQKKIHSGLQQMGFSVMKEHQVETLPMYLDIVTTGQGKNGEKHTVAVEVDGPSHFVHTPTGPHALDEATRLRNAALLLHDVHVRS